MVEAGRLRVVRGKKAAKVVITVPNEEAGTLHTLLDLCSMGAHDWHIGKFEVSPDLT